MTWTSHRFPQTQNPNIIHNLEQHLLTIIRNQWFLWRDNKERTMMNWWRDLSAMQWQENNQFELCNIEYWCSHHEFYSTSYLDPSKSPSCNKGPFSMLQNDPGYKSSTHAVSKKGFFCFLSNMTSLLQMLSAGFNVSSHEWSQCCHLESSLAAITSEAWCDNWPSRQVAGLCD